MASRNLRALVENDEKDSSQQQRFGKILHILKKTDDPDSVLIQLLQVE